MTTVTVDADDLRAVLDAAGGRIWLESGVAVAVDRLRAALPPERCPASLCFVKGDLPGFRCALPAGHHRVVPRVTKGGVCGCRKPVGDPIHAGDEHRLDQSAWRWPS